MVLPDLGSRHGLLTPQRCKSSTDPKTLSLGGCRELVSRRGQRGRERQSVRRGKGTGTCHHTQLLAIKCQPLQEPRGPEAFPWAAASVMPKH